MSGKKSCSWKEHHKRSRNARNSGIAEDSSAIPLFRAFRDRLCLWDDARPSLSNASQQRSVQLDSIPQIADAEILIRRMLIVVVVRDRQVDDGDLQDLLEQIGRARSA